jgi:hypothetical protein
VGTQQDILVHHATEWQASKIANEKVGPITEKHQKRAVSVTA